MSLEPSELFPEVPNLYEFPSVHHDMIYDEHRVGAYRRAIEAVIQRGDVVVDVGAGTGLLAFLCLQAGASRVHAIERSPIIDAARRLADENGFSDRVVFHSSDSRDTALPERADLMVSELIGHMAFEEGMVESLFDARSRFLKPGGRMIPQAVTLNAAPVQERSVYESCIDSWKPVAGIEFSAMRRRALETSYLVDIAERDLVADYQPVMSFVLEDGTNPQAHSEQVFVVRRTGRVNGVALWFDARLSESVRLSSGPWSKTHWLQCFAPVPSPLEVAGGDLLRVTLDMRFRTRRDDRFVFSVDVVKEQRIAEE